MYTYELQFADGSWHTFEACDQGPYVKFFVFDAQKRILLVNEFRHSQNEYSLRIPGGLVDLEETPEEAALRECQEELGVRPKHIQLYATSRGGNHGFLRDYAFVCSQLEDAPLAKDHGEDLTVVSMSLEELENKVLEGELANDWKGLIFLRIKRDLENGKLQL